MVKSRTEKQPATINIKPASGHCVQRDACCRMLDNRSIATLQLQLMDNVDNSQVLTLQRQQIENTFGSSIQKDENEGLLQRKYDTVQRHTLEEEEPLQGKLTTDTSAIQLLEEATQPDNRTGIPDQLKAGIETLSGMDMSDVRVHYNSSKPAQLNALAFAQATRVIKCEKNNNQGPIQAIMDTTKSFTECDVDLTSKKANTFKASGLKALSGSAAKTHVYLTTLTKQNNPPDLKNMGKWRKYLKDPKTGNTLTKMHQINGVFFGPMKTTNIFLGTAASNNTDNNSHLRQVEQPIEKYMGVKSPRAVDYTVEPGFGTVPGYIQKRINGIISLTEKSNFEKWAKQATPAQYTCTATFYRLMDQMDVEGEEKKDKIESLTQIEVLDADL